MRNPPHELSLEHQLTPVVPRPSALISHPCLAGVVDALMIGFHVIDHSFPGLEATCLVLIRQDGEDTHHRLLTARLHRPGSLQVMPSALPCGKAQRKLALEYESHRPSQKPDAFAACSDHL